MKNLVTILLSIAFIGCGIIVINPKYSDLSENEKKNISPKIDDSVQFINQYRDFQNHIIYITNANHTKKIISKIKSKYALLVFYASWCYPCRQEMPKVKSFLDANNDLVTMLFISTSEWTELQKDKDYLISQDLKIGASLVVDIIQYDDKLSPKKRFEEYYTDLSLSDYEFKNVGYPTFILVKKDLTHLVTNTGNFNSQEYLDIMR